MRSLTLLALGVTACTVPYAVPSDDTDTGGTDPDSDVPVESDTPDTPPPSGDDTGWASTGDDTDDAPPVTLVGGCHPYDPVDATPGWVRRYNVTYGRDQGSEVHTGYGLDVVPAGWAGPVAQGFAYDVSITSAGDANSEGRYWTVCDHDGTAGAYDIAWTKEIAAGLLGQQTVTLRAAAKQPRRYLPGEAEILGGFANWQETMRYQLTQVGGTVIPGGGSADLKHDGQYVAFGFESVTVPYRTFPHAWHLSIIYTEEKVDSGGVFEQLFGVFDSLFGALLGFSGGQSVVQAQSDRWYVLGIGLVKEETIDSVSGQLIVRKELKTCSGLPECP
ncbi:MAG TPA: hypothetical protein PKA64_08860 [Myxococcota bacterium]|nr:hypothetical protein [Myxococcota bacterium]